jgi:hypothetical protein
MGESRKIINAHEASTLGMDILLWRAQETTRKEIPPDDIFFWRKSLRTYLRVLKPDCGPPGPIGNILAIASCFLLLAWPRPCLLFGPVWRLAVGGWRVAGRCLLLLACTCTCTCTFLYLYLYRVRVVPLLAARCCHLWLVARCSWRRPLLAARYPPSTPHAPTAPRTQKHPETSASAEGAASWAFFALEHEWIVCVQQAQQGCTDSRAE